MADNQETVGAYPPPPGITPNFVNPENQTANTIILHTIVLVFVTVFVAIRIYTRSVIKHFLSYDDYFILLAYTLTVTFSAMLLASDTKGCGRHIWDIPAVQLIVAMKYLFVAEVVYLPLTAVIKLSILLCYQRIFTQAERAKWLIYFGIFAVSIFYFIFFFTTVFYCTPIAKAWNPMLSGHCLSESSLPLATGIFNMISDFYILIIPMPCIWGLTMKFSRKVRVVSIFGVGLFTCVASIVRFAMTQIWAANPDVTWNYVKQEVWAVLEVDVGILCSCALAFPAFFDASCPGSLGSLFGRVRSYLTSTRRSDSGSDIAHSNNEFITAKLPSCGSSGGSDSNKSRSNGFDPHGDTASLQESKISDEDRDFYSEASLKRNASNDDVEAWPGQVTIRTTDVEK